MAGQQGELCRNRRGWVPIAGPLAGCFAEAVQSSGHSKQGSSGAARGTPPNGAAGGPPLARWRAVLQKQRSRVGTAGRTAGGAACAAAAAQGRGEQHALQMQRRAAGEQHVLQKQRSQGVKPSHYNLATVFVFSSVTRSATVDCVMQVSEGGNNRQTPQAVTLD